MIIDTHAHYDDEAFDDDRDELINGLKNNGISIVINASSNLNSCLKTVELTKKYDFFYGAIGIHPCDTKELTDENYESVVKKCLNNKKIVAVGEIGLDYYWNEPERDIQIKWFEEQIELAKNVNKPIVVHSRDAAKDTLDIIKNSHADQAGGTIHCFSYGTEMAREYLNLGFFLGIGGVVTFNNAKKLKEVVEYMPIDRMLLETDCPYLSPVPFRGKRNCSSYLAYVVEAISQIKGISKEEIIEKTSQNAKKLFGLDNN